MIAGGVALAATRDLEIRLRAQLVGVRDAIFSRVEKDSAFFEQPPKWLTDHGFRWEDSGVLEGHRLLDDSVALMLRTESDVIRRGMLLADHLARGTRGCGGLGTNIAAKYDWVRGGGGCCSDHTEIFLAIAAEVGLISREVENSGHAMVEVWDQRHKSWVLLDPTIAIRFDDDRGQPLSLLATRRRILDGTPPQVHWFGTAMGTNAHAADSLVQFYYGPKAAWPLKFAQLALVYGANVRVQSLFAGRVAYLGRSGGQLVAQLLGVRPLTVYLLDSSSRSILAWRDNVRVLGVVASTLLMLSVVLVKRRWNGRSARGARP